MSFLRYIQAAFDEFAESFADGSDAPPIAAAGKPSLPELFTLLASRPFTPSASVSRADRVPKEEAARFLVNVLHNKLKPSDVLSGSIREPQVRAAAERLITAVANDREIDIQPEEARQILHLFETGEFFNEIPASSAAIIYCLPGLPVAVFSDAQGALSPTLITAVLKDLVGFLGVVSSFKALESILEDLRDGTFDHPPKVMTHTLTELYQRATISTGLKTIHQLYAKENKAVRLATILYARSQGVDLTDQDIDLALDTALNPENPDLGPALARAYAKLTEARKAKEK